MKYNEYGVRDFIHDEDFQQWVLHPDKTSDARWRSWLNAHPEKLNVVDEARQLLQSVSFPQHTLAEDDVAALWTKITEAKSTDDQSIRSPFWRYAAAAACMVMIAAGGFLLKVWITPWKEYNVPYGQTQNITLPDGSVIVLNANSEVTLKHEWNTTDPREVWLQGEAFFDVRHKESNQPFTVYTAEGVSVDVLGTTFNVYHRSDETKVVLTTGQIRLKLPPSIHRDEVMMKPGEMVEYKSNRFRKFDVNTERYTSWTNNIITLDHTPLAEMVRMLEDTYGLEVRVSSSALLDETVSGSMPHGDADALIKQLAMTYRMKMKRRHNMVTIDILKPE